jgi:hypothetical protein
LAMVALKRSWPERDRLLSAMSVISACLEQHDRGVFQLQSLNAHVDKLLMLALSIDHGVLFTWYGLRATKVQTCGRSHAFEQAQTAQILKS